MNCIFGRETFVNTFMLQIAVLSNHLNGRDTHVRQIKVYGPRPCVFYLSVHNLLFTSFWLQVYWLNTPPPPLFLFFFKCSIQEPFSASAFSIYFKRVRYVLLCEMRNMTLPTKEKNCETVSRGEVKHVAKSSQTIEEWWRVSSLFPMSINYGVHISIIVEERTCITNWFSSDETYPVSDCLTCNWSKAAWNIGPYCRGFSLSLIRILTFWESHGYKMLLLCLKIEAIIIIFQVLRAGGTEARVGTWNSLFVPQYW